MTQTIEKTDTDTLRKWLRNNARILGNYHPTNERAQLQLCQIHIRNIRAELASRAEK